MYLIHPKRIWRRLCHMRQLYLLRKQAKKFGIQLIIGKNVRIVDCSVSVGKYHRDSSNHKLIIEDYCDLQYTSFAFPGSNNTIRIGEGTKINAGIKSRTVFHVGDDSSVIIGEDCLFSNTIIFSTTDYHKVYDDSGNRVNLNKDIKVGEHVWIGQKAYICKGVTIPNGSIVGACSVVTKSFNQENIILAGNPASIRKENIHWEP